MSTRSQETWRLTFVPDPDHYEKQVQQTWLTIQRRKHNAALAPSNRIEEYEAAIRLQTAFLLYLKREDDLLRLDAYMNLPLEVEVTAEGNRIAYRVLMAGPFQGFMLLGLEDSTVYGAKFLWHKTEE